MTLIAALIANNPLLINVFTFNLLIAKHTTEKY
jgi:hypothetical protein